MPAYLSMYMVFTHRRIKASFIMNAYKQIIDAGFNFLGEYYRSDDEYDDHEPAYRVTTLESIADWNQANLEDRLRQGFPKINYRTDGIDADKYKQILFQREGYSEVRGIWWDYSKHSSFCLVVPEDDVLFYSNGNIHYIHDKIAPFTALAKQLWESGMVDAVHTELECDDPPYGVYEIFNGKDIWLRPFAVLPESVYAKFPADYFVGADISKLTNNGIYLEQLNDRKRVKYLKETVILASEPLQGFTPDDVRQWLHGNDTEHGLATALAKVYNQTGWLGHDLDEFEEPELFQARAVFNEWWTLCKELYKKVTSILRDENNIGKANHDLSCGRMRDILMPFMDRNGYHDGAGWWIPKNEMKG